MSFRILLSAALVAISACASHAAQAAPKAPAKPAVAKPAAAFGLTQALATLQVCPNARFEGDSMMALGGVLQENQKRINAAPVDKRMELMNQLVADETAKATAWHKANKLDCATAAEQGAGYWNRTIQTLASAQQAEALEKQKKSPAAKPAVSVGAAVTLP
jgi:hypothetical protein